MIIAECYLSPHSYLHWHTELCNSAVQDESSWIFCWSDKLKILYGLIDWLALHW